MDFEIYSKSLCAKIKKNAEEITCHLIFRLIKSCKIILTVNLMYLI